MMQTDRTDGFTLLEVVFALFLIAVAVIATAPLFVFAAAQNAGAGELGTAGASAERQMEVLRNQEFASLVVGGNLDSNVAGYFDATNAEYLLRWTIGDNPNPPVGTKIIAVRAIARQPAVGQTKETTFVTVRGN